MPLLARNLWADDLAQAVAAVNEGDIHRTAELIHKASLVVVAGNGGSSALASHLAQAISKPSYSPGGGKPAVCLTDAVPTLTAHTNDGGWGEALLESARPFLDSIENCALVAISSSGRSENVCRLARLFADRGRVVITLTGFSGEPLRGLATVALHCPSTDYEVVEPAHDAIIHRVQAHLRHLGEK